MIAGIALLLVCAALRPFQLDEVLEMIETRSPSLRGAIGSTRLSPGAMPLGYLIEWAVLKAAGVSRLAVRLPSALSVLVALACLRRTLLLMTGRRPPVAMLVAAASLPMLFRYAIEARPYGMAFALSALATLLLIENRESRSWRWLVLYGLLLTAAPLVQTDAGLVTLGHLVFLATGGISAPFWITLVSVVPAAAWVLFMRAGWAGTIAFNHYTFSISLAFLKDISGGGIVCSLLLFGAASVGAWAMWRDPRSGRTVRLLVVIAAAVLLGAIAADAAGGYFASPRQAIYSLIPLVVLGFEGWRRMSVVRPAAAWVLLGIFLAIAAGRDVATVRSREGWELASRTAAAVVKDGFCLEPASDLSAPLALYAFFAPELEQARCGVDAPKAALISNAFVTAEERERAAARLRTAGYRPAGHISAGGTDLEKYIR